MNNCNIPENLANRYGLATIGYIYDVNGTDVFNELNDYIKFHNIDYNTDDMFSVYNPSIFMPQYYNKYGYWMMLFKLEHEIPLTSFEKTIYNVKFDNNIDTLRDDYLNKRVYSDPTFNSNVKKDENVNILYRKIENKVYGFITPDNIIYLDKDSLNNPNTMFHEFYHLYDKILVNNSDESTQAYSIITRANELIVESGHLNEVQNDINYKHLSLELQQIEARARMIGDYAENKFNNNKISKLVNDIIEYIKSLFDKGTFDDYSNDEILKMNIVDFNDIVINEMINNDESIVSKDLNKVLLNKLKSVFKPYYKEVTFDKNKANSIRKEYEKRADIIYLNQVILDNITNNEYNIVEGSNWNLPYDNKLILDLLNSGDIEAINTLTKIIINDNPQLSDINIDNNDLIKYVAYNLNGDDIELLLSLDLNDKEFNDFIIERNKKRIYNNTKHFYISVANNYNKYLEYNKLRNDETFKELYDNIDNNSILTPENSLYLYSIFNKEFKNKKEITQELNKYNIYKNYANSIQAMFIKEIEKNPNLDLNEVANNLFDNNNIKILNDNVNYFESRYPIWTNYVDIIPSTNIKLTNSTLNDILSVYTGELYFNDLLNYKGNISFNLTNILNKRIIDLFETDEMENDYIKNNVVSLVGNEIMNNAKFRNDIQSLFNKSMNKNISYGINFGVNGEYYKGLQNVRDFVTESLTNERFISYLKSLNVLEDVYNRIDFYTNINTQTNNLERNKEILQEKYQELIKLDVLLRNVNSYTIVELNDNNLIIDDNIIDLDRVGYRLTDEDNSDIYSAINDFVYEVLNEFEEFNDNDTTEINEEFKYSIEELYDINPKLKDFIESVTDENDILSLYKVKEILNEKKEGRIVKLNKILYNVVTRLFDNNVFSNSNLKVKFGLLPDNAVGNFNRETNQMTIDKVKFLNIVNESYQGDEIFYLGYILNHELIHYLTPDDLSLKIEYVDRALNREFGFAFKLEHEREFGKNIKELYDIAITTLEDISDYGFTNLAEFVAEAMSNPNFQEKLASIPYNNTKKSLWKRFIEILSAYLSLDTGKPITNTLLEQVIAEVTNYISENSNIPRTYKIRKKGDDVFFDFNYTIQDNININDKISGERQKQIEELFNENPELANSVYEALRFIVKTKIDTIKTPIEIRRELLEKQERGQLSLDGEDIDIISQSRSNPTEENIQKLKDLYNTEIGLLQDSIINEITPEQKQQALQTYSQYLDTGRQDIEGFKEFINNKKIDNTKTIEIKEGVSELFESNLELANAVYEALGVKQDSALESKLKTFFNNFGFKFKEGDSSTDLLNKIIYTSSKDSSVFINNSVKAISQLLLANTNIDFHKLESLIESTPEFKKALSNSSDYLKTTHKFLKDGNRIPMEEWVSYIKDYNKIKNEVLEKYIKESLLDSNNSTRLHKLINDFLKWFKDLFANSKNLKEVTDSLIQQVLMNQKEVVINSKDLQNKERVTLAKALEETTHGKDIIKTFGEFGLILTGSVSAAEQGSVFRKVGKLLHDIDWVVPKGFTKDFNKKLKDTFSGATLVREFDSSTYYTQTYIVPPKGYTISNLTFFKPKVYGERKYIASYDVLDKNGNIVSNYRRYYDVKESGKVVENREVYNEGLKNVDKNLEAVSVDFFQNKEDLKYKPYNVNIEGVNLQLSNWLSSFTEKLKYGRAKDLLDYANFIPNDVIPSTSQITPQQKLQAQQIYSQYLEQNPNGGIQGFKEFVQGKQFQKLTAEEKAKTIEQVTKEHRSIAALKDLAAKLAWRIGGKVKFENNPNADWKGFNQGMDSVLNEAYMTSDTPFHEVMAHPIIRAIKNIEKPSEKVKNYKVEPSTKTNRWHIIGDYGQIKFTLDTKKQAEEYLRNLQKDNSETLKKLYQNLLKELEYGKGKEILDEIKKNYINKFSEIKEIGNEFLELYQAGDRQYENLKEAQDYINNVKHTLEEQQEEALVTLLGMMASDKLDKVKDATLISKLKELWKQISDFVKTLLRQDSIIIEDLPIDTTLEQLAEIMGYGNNKIILPGYKVEYQTPLGNKYNTLQEVNNEISQLADSDADVDLDKITINDKEKDFEYFSKAFDNGGYENIITYYVKFGNDYYQFSSSTFNYAKKYLDNPERFIETAYESKYYDPPFKITKENYDKTKLSPYEGFYSSDFEGNVNSLEGFIKKNKQFEQSKEILTQWIRENDIIYNPEEVYSRGQGFYSSIGAYSTLEVDLLFQNLLQHIEDNKKANGEFTISAFTKPIDSRLKHIEGTESKVRFVIFPQSQDIKWAAPTDVYSGSVWDAHEKINKDKKSELLGVAYSKYPSLETVNKISPNLADIIDKLSHVHNELGIELTFNNFRIEYDSDIDFHIKQLIDNINKTLDVKYGKLVKPDLSKKILKFENLYEVRWKSNGNVIIRTTDLQKAKDTVDENSELIEVTPIQQIGIQPTQTNDTLKESIENIKNNLINSKSTTEVITKEEYENVPENEWTENGTIFYKDINDEIRLVKIQGDYFKETLIQPENKEYTSQALVNLKIAALKEVARKYPRSLITSKVVPIINTAQNIYEIQYSKLNNSNEEILDESKIDYQKDDKELVDMSYELFPELNNIGSKELFQQYLNNTFENSRNSSLKEIYSKYSLFKTLSKLSGYNFKDEKWLYDNNMVFFVEDSIKGIDFLEGLYKEIQNDLHNRRKIDIYIANVAEKVYYALDKYKFNNQGQRNISNRVHQTSLHNDIFKLYTLNTFPLHRNILQAILHGDIDLPALREIVSIKVENGYQTNEEILDILENSLLNIPKEFIKEDTEKDIFGNNIKRIPTIIKNSNILSNTYYSLNKHLQLFHSFTVGVKYEDSQSIKFVLKPSIKKYIKDFRKYNNSNVEQKGNIKPTSISILNKMADDFQSRYNITFKVIRESEAMKLLDKNNVPNAFYYEPTNTAYIVEGKANEISVVHELGHAFLYKIKNDNIKLYNNLVEEARNMPEITDYVNRVYGQISKDKYEQEVIMRAIDLYNQDKLDAKENKGLIDLITEFLLSISSYIKDLLGFERIDVNIIEPDTKLKDIADLLYLYKGNMDLSTKNKTQNFTYDERQNIRNIVNGNESEGIGNIAESARNYIVRSNKTIGGGSNNIGREKELLEEFLKENPQFIYDIDENPLGTQVAAGAQSKVYMSEDDTKYVYKKSWLTAHGGILENLTSILLHNMLFNNVEYEILGFYISDDFEKYNIILKQRFVLKEQMYNYDSIVEYLTHNHFIEKNGVFNNFDLKIKVTDLHPGNVYFANNKIFFIDPIVTTIPNSRDIHLGKVLEQLPAQEEELITVDEFYNKYQDKVINMLDIKKIENFNKDKGYAAINVIKRNDGKYVAIKNSEKVIQSDNNFIPTYQGLLSGNNPVKFYKTGNNYNINSLSNNTFYINEPVEIDEKGNAIIQDYNNIIPTNEIKTIINERFKDNNDYYLNNLLKDIKLSNYLTSEEADRYAEFIKNVNINRNQKYIIDIIDNKGFKKLNIMMESDNIVNINDNFSPTTVKAIEDKGLNIEEMNNPLLLSLQSLITNGELSEELTCKI